MRVLDPVRRLLLLMALLAGSACLAQREVAVAHRALSMEGLLNWSPGGPSSAPRGVPAARPAPRGGSSEVAEAHVLESQPSRRLRVPLATRARELSTQLNPAQSFAHRVNYVPDGMHMWAGFVGEKRRFNLFNFTHWQYIDILTWFDGPVAVPSRQWIDAAHRNGVKIIGTVFPRTERDVALLTRRDAAGRYVAAHRLVAMAAHHGFDGWFFNVEVSVSGARAREMQKMLAELQRIKPEAMEVHWYDSMLPSGQVEYHNALNDKNGALMQQGEQRVSDAFFTNYFWRGPDSPRGSAATAQRLGRRVRRVPGR